MVLVVVIRQISITQIKWKLLKKITKINTIITSVIMTTSITISTTTIIITIFTKTTIMRKMLATIITILIII